MIGFVASSFEQTEVKAADRRAAPESQLRGVLVSTPYEGGPTQQLDLVQCCHCQRVWAYQRGSGVERGWCMNCSGITCGSRECDVCVPAEQLIKNLEAGMPFAVARQHRPIVGGMATMEKCEKTASGLLLGR